MWIATNCYTAHYWQQYAVSADLKTQCLLTSAKALSKPRRTHYPANWIYDYMLGHKLAPPRA